MKKVWINKVYSFAEAEKFDRDYYLQMDPLQRLEIVQLLREAYYKMKKGSQNENRKRLRRTIKIIQPQ